MEGILIFIGVLAFGLIIRLFAGSMDGNRVDTHIREMGGELVEKNWDPFGPGWFGEKDSRIYRIVYRDSSGSLHEAHVKTSMMSGVYLTNDRIIEKAPSESVEDEKARLRKRLTELENELH